MKDDDFAKGSVKPPEEVIQLDAGEEVPVLSPAERKELQRSSKGKGKGRKGGGKGSKKGKGKGKGEPQAKPDEGLVARVAKYARPTKGTPEELKVKHDRKRKGQAKLNQRLDREAAFRAAKAEAGNSQMKALLLISSGVFGALSIWFVASAVLQPLKVEWGFSDVEGSFLTSVVNLGFCFGCFFSALLNLADVFSAPALILVGGLSAAVANASLLLVRGFWGALLMRCLVGLGLSLVYPPSVKLLSTWYSADKRSAAMGVMISFFCIGSAFPQLLNALATGYSWRLIAGLSSLLGAAASSMTYAFVETGPYPFPRGGFDARAAYRLCRNRNVALSIVAYCGHQWELFCVWAWSAEFFEHIWGTSQQSAHMWAFVIISMGGPGSWLGGLLGDRYGRAMSALLMVSVSGLCTLVLGVVENHWPFAIWICICLLWGLTALADSPNYSALVTLHAEQSNVGTAVTVQLFCGYLATILALWLVPMLSAAWSWRWSLASLSLGPALSVLALLLLRPRAKDVDEGSIKGPASSDAP